MAFVLRKGGAFLESILVKHTWSTSSVEKIYGVEMKPTHFAPILFSI